MGITTTRRGALAVAASTILAVAAVTVGSRLATAEDPDPIAVQAASVLDTLTGMRFLEFVTTPQLDAGIELEGAGVPTPDVRVGWFAATYREELLDLADMVAERTEIPAGELMAAWETTTDERLRVLLTALSQLGDPYVWATDGPDGFDCSGLMRFAWAAADLDLPHLSVAQANSGEAVTPETLQVADLVHAPGHIMMWLGARDGIVESSGDGVAVGRWRSDSDAFTDPLTPRTVNWLVPDGVERDATGRIIDPDAPVTSEPADPVATVTPDSSPIADAAVPDPGVEVDGATDAVPDDAVPSDGDPVVADGPAPPDPAGSPTAADPEPAPPVVSTFTIGG